MKCARCNKEFTRSRPDANRQLWCSDYCRIFDKVDSTSDGCWPWKAKARHKFGYGMINMRGNVVPAHRATWAVVFGDPGLLSVLHRCDNPVCCNPDHLFLGTQNDNNKDMLAKGRHGMLGRKHTAETRRKISESRRALFRS